jgi:cytochrome P450
MQTFRRRYGEGPLRLRIIGRPRVLILSSDDVAEVLRRAPDPFTPATTEKQRALSHFEPNVSLITQGPARASRRQFSDDVLESAQPIHSCTNDFADIIRDRAASLCALARHRNELNWELFTDAWYAAARRIVLGQEAAEDRALTRDLALLRARANWILLPVRHRVRSRYRKKLASYLAKPGKGSLAEKIAHRQREGDERPIDQVTQWLFAFDGGGMTVFRAMAVLLGTDAKEKMAVDLNARRQGSTDLPFLRAAFLDAARLWPTTPALLRQATRETSIGGYTVPKGASIIIYAPYFHRDRERLTNADRFVPEFWLGRDPADGGPFIPFSAGPAACPGRNLISLIGSLWLATLLQGGVESILSPGICGSRESMPVSLDPFDLRFGLSETRPRAPWNTRPSPL